MLDLNDILSKSVVALVMSAGTWLFSTVLRLRKDMDAAFVKIRGLEKELAYDTRPDEAWDPDKAAVGE